MKSAVSSSSSGSERVSASGVVSGSGYDLEDTKSKTNSRMSCASDDSCAINELLEGRMDLSVTLPNSANPVVVNVERRTPMLDLLVNISTQYRFNAANYTINAGDHEFKASTPIGTLDVNQISIIPKNVKSGTSKGNTPSVMPFQTTFRLQVNLPRNQLMVMRVTPNATIAAIKQIICSEKALDANKYQLVRFTGKSEGPHILDSNKTLAFYTLNEITLVSNKKLAQIELQYGTPGASQVDMSSNTSDSVIIKKPMNSMLSQSNPDFTTIDEKTVLNHTNSKQLKKRPAPPPPMPSSATLPNKSFSLQMTQNKEENNSSIDCKNDSNLKFDENVSKTTQNIIETKPVLRISKNSVTHVRQNSGSDSSGYHESVLSSDSPESSSATTLPKSSSLTETIPSNNNPKQTNNVLNQKSGTKKRRAPPPPTNYSTHDSDAQPVKPINGRIHNTNDIIDESKVVLECMSDVSLPLSTSSSSSGTASDINRSLSPIVITQSNGSSTPLQQTPVNYSDNSLDSESKQCSSDSDSDKTIDNQRQESNESPVICVPNNENNIKLLDTDLENSKQLDESNVNVGNHKEDQQIRQNNSVLTVVREEDLNDSKEVTFDKNETSIGLNDSNRMNGSDNENTSKSTESLPKAEVSCTAPALVVSHDTELSGHDCTEQVVERNINNLVDKEKSGVNQNTSDNCDNQTNEFAIDPTLTLNNSDLDLEEMSITLPPPSPFQNRHNEENNNSSQECHNEGQPIVEQSVFSSSPHNEVIIEALSDKNISNEQMMSNSDNLVTKEDSIDTTIELKQTNNNNNDIQTENENQMTTNSPIVVSDEDSINKEIEVTLQSLNDELDRLESCDQLETSLSDSREATNGIKTNNEINSVINNSENDTNIESNNINVSLEVKQTNENNFPKIQEIKSKFESKVSPNPSPTPRVMSTLNKEIKSEPINQMPVTTNGKTTLFINNNQSSTPRPLSPPTTSASPSPTNEDKLSITEEVRQLCRPRVRLTNFSIGSYKKEVDIFEDTPKPAVGAMTAPIKSSAQSFVTFPSVKKEEKSRPSINQSKSKVEITSNSTTATTTTTSKSKTPVIQTLITSAPKINRIQSWSGQKSVTLQEKNIKQPVKTNERYVSQISITKDLKNSDKESNEDLRSPHLVVQSLSAKIEDEIKSRSPSPKEVIQKVETNKERVTISIKPGLESIIRSNSKQNNSLNTNNNNAINNKNNIQRNDSQQNTTKTKGSPQINTSKIEETVKESTPLSVPPPVPPPIPPPVPQIIPSSATNNSFKNKINTKIFHTKGWKSERMVRSGEVPKVKHVEPPTNVNVRDQLLNEIKSFGGKNSLKRVSNNSSWKLEVNTINA